MPIRFEFLTARHIEKVAPFDCGNSTINDWLRQDALKEKIDEKYTTYVAVEEETGNENIVGYVAVRADFIRYPRREREGMSMSFLSWRFPTWGGIDIGSVGRSASVWYFKH